VYLFLICSHLKLHEAEQIGFFFGNLLCSTQPWLYQHITAKEVTSTLEDIRTFYPNVAIWPAVMNSILTVLLLLLASKHSPHDQMLKEAQSKNEASPGLGENHNCSFGKI